MPQFGVGVAIVKDRSEPGKAMGEALFEQSRRERPSGIWRPPHQVPDFFVL